jgi:hypothetical protein
MQALISVIFIMVSLSVSAFGVINTNEGPFTQSGLAEVELISEFKLGSLDDLRSVKALQEFSEKSFKIQRNLLFPGQLIHIQTKDGDFFSGLNALHRAVLSGDLDLCKRVYEQRPDLVGLKDSQGLFAFDYALAKGETEIADFLVRQGNDLFKSLIVLSFPKPYAGYLKTRVMKKECVSHYSIVLAIVYNHVATVKWFFEFVKKVKHAQGKPTEVSVILKNSQSRNPRYNLLRVAIAYGSGSVVDFLVRVIEDSSVADVQKYFLTHLGKLTEVVLIRSVRKQEVEKFSVDAFEALLRMDERKNFVLSGILANEENFIEVLFLNESRLAIHLLKKLKDVIVASPNKEGAIKMFARLCGKKSLRELINEVKNKDFRDSYEAVVTEIQDSLQSAEPASSGLSLKEAEVQGCQSIQQPALPSPLRSEAPLAQSPVLSFSSGPSQQISSPEICEYSRTVLVLAQIGSIDDVSECLRELKERADLGHENAARIFNQAVCVFEDGSRDNILQLLLKRNILTPGFLNDWVYLLSVEQIISLFFHENLKGEAPIRKLMELKEYQGVIKEIARRQSYIQEALRDQETERLGVIANRFKRFREAILKDIEEDEGVIARFRNKLQRSGSRAG